MKTWTFIAFFLSSLGYYLSSIVENTGYASFFFNIHPGKITDSLVNVHTFGVIGDSLTDQTDQIQNILNDYDKIYFPPGHYLISRSLELKDNQIIQGSGNSTFISTEKTLASKDFSFFTINSKKNIAVSNLTFRSIDNPAQNVVAILATNVSHLTIRKVEVYNGGIIETWVDRQYPYKIIPSDFHSDAYFKVCNSFIEIDSCFGVGSENYIAHRTNGVLFYYASDWKITNSTFSRYNHGIQWWGGDSHPDRHGDTVNVRKSRNGLVAGVAVDQIRGGGIWGSMGENITVKNCKVANCGDVGIDFEGCFNAQALDNDVKNCKNGCIATFHYNRNILFKNNRLSQAHPAHPLACIYNAAQKQDNGKVIFYDNTFTAHEKIGLIKQSGPSSHIEFVKNQLHNVVLNLSFNNNKYILIKENTFNITRSITPYNYIIKAGQTHNKGVLEIERNQIINSAQQKENLYALSTTQSDYNSSPVNRISENLITGIPYQIKIEWAGANKGVTCTTFINSDPSMPDASIKKIDSGKKPSKLYINGKEQP